MSTQERFPLDFAPEGQIDVACSQEQLEQLFARITAGWDRLAQDDPHFNVITNPLFHWDCFGENQQKFWDSGVWDGERFMAWMKRNEALVDPEEATCLEYGCGAGRITRYLATQFKTVIGCDVSLEYLALANAALPSDAGAWRLIEIENPERVRALPQFDALFSILVLQHNPPPVIGYLLDELMGLIRPGGVAFFQLPTFIKDYSFNCEEYLKNPESGSKMEMHAFPQRWVFQIAEANGCLPLQVQQDDLSGAPELHISTTFLFQKD